MVGLSLQLMQGWKQWRLEELDSALESGPGTGLETMCDNHHEAGL